METSNVAVAIIVLVLVAVVVWGIVVLLGNPLVQALVVLLAVVAVLGMLKRISED